MAAGGGCIDFMFLATPPPTRPVDPILVFAVSQSRSGRRRCDIVGYLGDWLGSFGEQVRLEKRAVTFCVTACVLKMFKLLYCRIQ